MRLAFGLVLALLAAPAAAAAPRAVAVLVDRADAAKLPAARQLAAAARGRADLTFHELVFPELLDPIEKGRLVAHLQRRDLIVAVGDGASEFVFRELEDTPVYFVGASLVPGESLAAPSVTALFSYNVDELLDAVKRARPGPIGLAYTPGYEPVAAWIRRGASERGLAVAEKKVTAVRELAPAVRELLARARWIWVVGDPLLVRGAGFEFLRERSLASAVPLIANGAREVHQGAFMAFEPEAASLESRADKIFAALLRGDLPSAERLQPGPRAGTIVFNEALSMKWGIAPQSAPAWRPVR